MLLRPLTQETAAEAEKKIVQCRECFARLQESGNFLAGAGSEIKTAWMFGGHLWNSGTPGYVKPYTPEGADVNYEQLCFMVSSFVGLGMNGRLTGYKLTSSPASTAMLRRWSEYKRTHMRLLNAPMDIVRRAACVFPPGAKGWNMSDT